MENQFEKGYSLCLNEWALDKEIKNELGLLLIISGLCAKKGFCYASNEYLAKIFNETKISISRKIKKLEAKNYIKVVYKKRGFEVVAREIRLTKLLTDDYQNCLPSINNFVNGSINQNVKEINTSNINTNIIKVSKKEVKSYEEILSDFSLSERLTNCIMDFIQMRKFIKKPLTNRGLELMINKLQKMTPDEDKQIKILEQSIMNNWQGIFELKEAQKTQQQIEDEEHEKMWDRLAEKYKDWKG